MKILCLKLPGRADLVGRVVLMALPNRIECSTQIPSPNSSSSKKRAFLNTLIDNFEILETYRCIWFALLCGVQVYSVGRCWWPARRWVRWRWRPTHEPWKSRSASRWAAVSRRRRRPISATVCDANHWRRCSTFSWARRRASGRRSRRSSTVTWCLWIRRTPSDRPALPSTRFPSWPASPVLRATGSSGSLGFSFS